MNREKAVDIMDNISDRLISESVVFRGSITNHSSMSHYRRPAVIAAILAVTVCLMCAGIIAYAENYYGIRDLLSGPKSEWHLREGAEQLIEQRTEVSESDIATVRISETLCDAYTVIATVDIKCDEDHFLVPLNDNKHTQNIDLHSSMSLIGFDTEETVSEYAARQCKKPLRVTGYIRGNDCELGVIQDWCECAFISDNEMTMLIRSYKTVSMNRLDGICCIYLEEIGNLQYGQWQDNTLEIPFEASETETRLLGVYSPADPEIIPGIILEDVTVTESALGINVMIPIKPISGSEQYLHTTLKCRDIEFTGGGLIWPDTSDGAETLNTMWYMGKGEISDVLVLQYWYCEYGSEPELRGEIVYEKR